MTSPRADTASASNPQIIQGGMGVAVSNWILAKAVSRAGQLGVVSGTALALVLLRRLQDGDPEGNVRRAMSHFPIPGVSERVHATYFIEGGKAESAPYKASQMPVLAPSPAATELTVLANFVEVFLAKENHDGVVGINFLEKIQLPNLASHYGAMLAGVDYVLMGAGIPRNIPGAIDALSEGRVAQLKIDVEGALPEDHFVSTFDPAQFWGGPAPRLKRPKFLAVVASATLALTLARKSNGAVNGFVVEGELAGGHNAPPRGPLTLNAVGEPIYGPRDIPEIAKIRDIGLPFWLAGSYGNPEKFVEALELGAAGIQVGTAFAFCEESGISPNLKRETLQLVRSGEAHVFTDPLASPTGFPFKVLQLAQTLSDSVRYLERHRICDLGYLRSLFRKPDGTAGYRCPAERPDDFISKGGDPAALVGRKCLCNGLMATAGYPQSRKDGYVELPLMTAGNDVSFLGRLLLDGNDSYSAGDVIRHILGNFAPLVRPEAVAAAAENLG